MNADQRLDLRHLRLLVSAETIAAARHRNGMSKVLILGGGFGGIYTALELERLLRRREDVEVTLVTRDNFFLFTPMLHEVAASDLELTNIVNPLRKMLKRTKT